MKIGIDARFYGIIGKGLGRYTQKLIEHLEKISAESGDFSDEYFIFLGKENFADYEPKNPNFHKILAPYRWYTLSEQIGMPIILNKYNLDLVHFPHFNVPFLYRKKFVVTIHDLILLQFPTVKSTTLNPVFYKIKFLAYKFIIWSAIKRAQKVITVSNFTKKELLKYYKKSLKEDKIVITYEAGNDNEKTSDFGSQNDLEILKNYGILKPYLLYVGNAYPHKNLERLVLAFGGLNMAQEYQLVLVGKTDYFYSTLKKMVQEKNIKDVIFLEQISDEILDTIYRKSKVFVFASLYEGFGIPPLEAMSRKIPVISSNHPCMKEILEDSVYFFDGQDENSITKAMREILENEEIRQDLIGKGLQQIKKYSWEKMSKETQKIYSEINEKKK